MTLNHWSTKKSISKLVFQTNHYLKPFVSKIFLEKMVYKIVLKIFLFNTMSRTCPGKENGITLLFLIFLVLIF